MAPPKMPADDDDEWPLGMDPDGNLNVVGEDEDDVGEFDEDEDE